MQLTLVSMLHLYWYHSEWSARYRWFFLPIVKDRKYVTWSNLNAFDMVVKYQINVVQAPSKLYITCFFFNTAIFARQLHNALYTWPMDEIHLFDFFTLETSSVSPSVCPSVRLSSGLRSVAPTVLAGSISYLCILSSNIKMCKFDFVLFWLGIWCESLL